MENGLKFYLPRKKALKALKSDDEGFGKLLRRGFEKRKSKRRENQFSEVFENQPESVRLVEFTCFRLLPSKFSRRLEFVDWFEDRFGAALLGAIRVSAESCKSKKNSKVTDQHGQAPGTQWRKGKVQWPTFPEERRCIALGFGCYVDWFGTSRLNPWCCIALRLGALLKTGLGHRGLTPLVLHCFGFWVSCRLFWGIEA